MFNLMQGRCAKVLKVSEELTFVVNACRTVCDVAGFTLLVR